MANLSRPLASRQILSREPALRPRVQLRRVAIVLAIIGGVLALAWFNGGEEPLHPIAQTVALPQSAPGDAQ
jgi:hypothetical protein